MLLECFVLMKFYCVMSVREVAASEFLRNQTNTD